MHAVLIFWQEHDTFSSSPGGFYVVLGCHNEQRGEALSLSLSLQAGFILFCEA